MTYRSNSIICLVALALAARGVNGQAPQSMAITIAGGMTTLTPESRRGRAPGGHVQLGLSRTIRSIISDRLRLDASYHSLEFRASPVFPTISSGVWIATASVEKDIVAFHEFRPYLVAGVGTIAIDQGSGHEAHLNFAGGAGVVLPHIGRVRPFVEGRFQRAMTGGSNSFIPLSIGIAF